MASWISSSVGLGAGALRVLRAMVFLRIVFVIVLGRGRVAVEPAVVVQRAGFHLSEEDGTDSAQRGEGGVIQQRVVTFEDTLYRAGVEAPILLKLG